MRLPFDRLCPTLYRWLQLTGLDHLLEFSSTIRTILLLSSAISLTFSICWLLDVIQFTCVSMTPWTQEGMGKHTCLVHLVGGVIMFFMFQTSSLALAYYDEDGEELRLKKERSLGELEKQMTEVLERAQGQASKLCTILTEDLGERVHEHVKRMRLILEKIEHDQSPLARRTYCDLVTAMAHHLHRLREPAMEHFQKLIVMTRGSGFLTKALRDERQQSMVELLTLTKPDTRPVPRGATMAADDFGAFAMLQAVRSGRLPFAVFGWGGDDSEVGRMGARLRMPTEADLREELRPCGEAERRDSPESSVLRPLRLVLRWLEKITAKSSGAGPSRLRSRHTVVAYSGPLEQLNQVVKHLRKSPFYRSILVGIICSIAFFFFDFHVLLAVAHLLQTDSCSGQNFLACLNAVVRQLLSMLAMVCYTGSLTVVLWNVERLDNVLKVQEDIEALEDFKRHVDELNAHDLQEDDCGVSMIQGIDMQLAEQKRLVATFFNRAWGGHIRLEDFEELAEVLRDALETASLTPQIQAPPPSGGRGEMASDEEEARGLLAG